jgi:arylsulfatase A-like enzyme
LRKLAPDVNRSVLRWLERDQDRPFFAFLNYFDVHAPYQSPEPYRSRFSHVNDPDGLVTHKYLDSLDPSTRERLLEKIDAYGGGIAYVDAHIGQLLAEIQRRGLDDNLLVVITSDHGEAFKEHGVTEHSNSVYREEIHVPLILWMPGKVPSNVQVSQPVSIASLPATILDIVDDPRTGTFSSPSLASLWEAPGAHPEWPMPLAEMEYLPWMSGWRDEAPASQGSMVSLTSPEWHYIEHETLGTSLYDWHNDPSEQQDLSGSTTGKTAIDWFKNSLSTVLARKP